MRYVLLVLLMLLGSATSAMAQLSVGLGLPGVNIGINLPLFPELVRVPDYPVYYAPRLDSNFFFYDGMYWVFQDDNWYASSWYNGPWGLVDPQTVPLFILRIPVRYYRAPPAYFQGWRPDTPPRWGERWGHEWERHHSGWDQWSRRSAPAPAPLPAFQQRYSGDRYPQAEQQRLLQGLNYRYQPRDSVVRQHYQEQGIQRAPAPSRHQPQATPFAVPLPLPPKDGEEVHGAVPRLGPPQQREPVPRDPRQLLPQRREKEREKDEERGHERSR